MPARQVTVTLSRAWNPGDGQDDEAVITFAAMVDTRGLPERDAWLADPAPWPARFARAGVPPQDGALMLDEESWLLRFATGPDAPSWRLRHIEPGLRPGEMLTLEDPQGRESAWRVVGLG